MPGGCSEVAPVNLGGWISFLILFEHDSFGAWWGFFGDFPDARSFFLWAIAFGCFPKPKSSCKCFIYLIPVWEERGRGVVMMVYANQISLFFSFLTRPKTWWKHKTGSSVSTFSCKMNIEFLIYSLSSNNRGFPFISSISLFGFRILFHQVPFELAIPKSPSLYLFPFHSQYLDVVKPRLLRVLLAIVENCLQYQEILSLVLWKSVSRISL